MKKLRALLLIPFGLDVSPSLVTHQHHVRLPKRFARTHLYTWVEKGAVREKCIAPEHNARSLAIARAQTVLSGVQCANDFGDTPSVEKENSG